MFSTGIDPKVIGSLVLHRAEAFFLVAVIVALVVLALSFALRPSLPSASETLKPPERPIAEEGKAIPKVFGTCVIKSPLVAWYGDIGYTPTKGLPEQSQE